MKASPPLVIKCAGGAAAQTLALMDAIYVTQNSGRPFVFEYYPSGTGTYWPFEIRGALLPEELGNTSKLSRGHDPSNNDSQMGKIVESHPVNSKYFNIENIYSLIRRLKLDNLFLRLRGEIPINSSHKRLQGVKQSTRVISGGFLPVLDIKVFRSLHERFLRGGYPSPFFIEKNSNTNYDLVIHYRIGDKRAKFTNPGVVGGDGILNPISIKNLVAKLDFNPSSMLVISDEPEVAKQLLSEVGLNVDIQDFRGSIWDDLKTMAAAKILVGTWSQVSQLAAVCAVGNGGEAYLPAERTGTNSLRWSIQGIHTYVPEFLDSNHPIYFKN